MNEYVSGTWVAASKVLGQAVWPSEEYPHVCGGSTPSGQRLQARECSPCSSGEARDQQRYRERMRTRDRIRVVERQQEQATEACVPQQRTRQRDRSDRTRYREREAVELW